MCMVLCIMFFSYDLNYSQECNFIFHNILLHVFEDYIYRLHFWCFLTVNGNIIHFQSTAAVGYNSLVGTPNAPLFFPLKCFFWSFAFFFFLKEWQWEGAGLYSVKIVYQIELEKYLILLCCNNDSKRVQNFILNHVYWSYRK